MRKASLLLFLVVCLALSLVQKVKAQNIAGVYQVTVTGSNYYLDIAPAKRRISAMTTMKISQTGEKITVEFGTFAGAMASTIFKGKVGNNLMAAVWWHRGSPYETKALWGEVSRDGQTIRGKLIYPRVAYRRGLVPGWVEVNFTARLREDCISFDYRRAEVRNIGGRWKIVVGRMWLKDFGNVVLSEREARQALRIIKHYRMNQQCFVGRPDPSMEYYLVNGGAPTGSLGGEDCVRFNPANIEVKRIGDRWKIIDGTHWIMDFSDKEGEARMAFRIIKKYGFNHICFVGRRDPSMTYFRR